MKILVTGANGRIGRYVMRELLASGHEVMGIDLHSSGEGNSPLQCVDLTDPGEVFQALAVGPAEAVVHLGAWSNAGRVLNTRTYGDNVRGTFNLFQACADLRIKRVISASSAQVYGLSKNPPIYLPLDEAHPLRPANCYALSKMAGEQAADYFSTRWNLRILSFRFMGVRTPLELEVEMDIFSKDPSNSGLLWTRTDARDAATACRLSLEKRKTRPRALTT